MRFGALETSSNTARPLPNAFHLSRNRAQRLSVAITMNRPADTILSQEAAAGPVTTGKPFSPEERRYLLSLPDTLSVSIGEESFLLLHGSPGNPNSGALWPHTDHADLQNEISEVRERHILCGHTHMAMNLEAGSHRILNPGTIGQPRDGDYRAQCLLIDDGDYFFERVEYDLDALEYDYKNSTIPEDVQETWTRYTRKGIVEVHGLQLGPFSERPRPTELK